MSMHRVVSAQRVVRCSIFRNAGGEQTKYSLNKQSTNVARGTSLSNMAALELVVAEEELICLWLLKQPRRHEEMVCQSLTSRKKSLGNIAFSDADERYQQGMHFHMFVE